MTKMKLYLSVSSLFVHIHRIHECRAHFRKGMSKAFLPSDENYTNFVTAGNVTSFLSVLS